MSRLINQPITVTLTSDPGSPEPLPGSFTWRGSRYTVAGVLDCWEETGRWWEQEPVVTVWRIQVRGGGVMELAMVHRQPPEWRLMVVWD